MSAKQILTDLIDELVHTLGELEYCRDRNNEFTTGQIYSFVITLEVIQSLLPSPQDFNLDFYIESEFPLD